LPIKEALERARNMGLDLVEVAPNSRPPVCRILDYGKFRYELSKKDRAAKKKQHTIQMKEMRYRPKIDDHDFEFKTRHVRAFIESGSKVKVFVMFRGREMAYTEFGQKLLDRVAQELSDISNVEAVPRLDGRKMTMVLTPKPDIVKKAKKAKTGNKVEQKQQRTQAAAIESE
jgi:translation initiation factor IF-3